MRAARFDPPRGVSHQPPELAQFIGLDPDRDIRSVRTSFAGHWLGRLPQVVRHRPGSHTALAPSQNICFAWQPVLSSKQRRTGLWLLLPPTQISPLHGFRGEPSSEPPLQRRFARCAATTSCAGRGAASIPES